MTQYETLVRECEEAIRAGRIHAAAKALASIPHAQVPREWRLPIARLCRRAGLFVAALKILTPVIVAPEHGLPIKPTDEELAEYGACLQINGSIEEAIAILSRVDTEKVPDSQLYLSWCHFARWEYAKAIPLLENYIESAVPEYWRTVGMVNLAAARAMTRDHDRAIEAIEDALATVRRKGLARLHANCLELRAQCLLQLGRDVEATVDLDEALRILGAAKVQDTLFVKKWLTLIAARQSRSTDRFKELQAEARALGRWELLRESDLFELTIAFDQKRFDRLAFGTPHTAYHERIAREVGVKHLASHAIIGSTDAPCMDVETGEIDGRLRFKAGCKTHQLIEVLLRDLYRPSTIGSLFAAIFPGEPFDVFSSPGRLHQIIRRARSWLQECELPLQVSEHDGLYSITCEGEFAFRLPLVKRLPDWCKIALMKLRHSQGNRAQQLKASEIKLLLGMTQDEYRRFSTWAIETGHLQRTYDGSTPLYSLTDRNEKAA